MNLYVIGGHLKALTPSISPASSTELNEMCFDKLSDLHLYAAGEELLAMADAKICAGARRAMLMKKRLTLTIVTPSPCCEIAFKSLGRHGSG